MSVTPFLSPGWVLSVLFKSEEKEPPGEKSFRGETEVPGWVTKKSWIRLFKGGCLEWGRRERKAGGRRVAVRLRASRPGTEVHWAGLPSRYRQRCMFNVRALRGHIPESEPKR